MASPGGPTGGDGGIGALEALIKDLQEKVNNLTSQLNNYSDATMEGSQSIDAINNRTTLYNKAIAQYTELINLIRQGATESIQGSALKEQAKKGYIVGAATKKGQTAAESLKDLADIESEGKLQRADIRSQEASHLAGAKGGLSNIYLSIADQEAALDAAKGSGGTGGGGGGSYSKEFQNYINDLKNEQGQQKSMGDKVGGWIGGEAMGKQPMTPAEGKVTGKSKKPTLKSVWPGFPNPIPILMNFIFKKYTK